VFVDSLIIDGLRSRYYPSGDRLLVIRAAALAEGIAVVRSYTEVMNSSWLWATVVFVVVFVEWARWMEEREDGEGREEEAEDLKEYCCCS